MSATTGTCYHCCCLLSVSDSSIYTIAKIYDLRKIYVIMSFSFIQTSPDNKYSVIAPPPTPTACHRSSFTNNDMLTEFLQDTLRVPNLVLPCKVFPKQNNIKSPPEINFNSLISSSDVSTIDEIMESLSGIGCFLLVNHGIPHDLIQSVVTEAAGIFRVPPENRVAVTMSSEKPYGFEEVQVEDESRLSEEFVWCRDKDLKLEMEGIWPHGYSKLCEKMERLSTHTDQICSKIVSLISANFLGKSRPGDSKCHIYKHKCVDVVADLWVNALRYDVIKMLVRGSDKTSSSLCFHICNGSSDFHVYSKQDWVSFRPRSDALIVTVGEHSQEAWSVGRPIFNEEECISMAFIYSSTPPTVITNNSKTISIAQQLIFAIFLTLIYQFFNKF